MIAFLMDHQTIFAAFAIAVLDFAFGVNEKLKSNGILHMIYLLLTGKK